MRGHYKDDNRPLWRDDKPRSRHEQDCDDLESQEEAEGEETGDEGGPYVMQAQLAEIVKKIEHHEEERREIAAEIAAVYADAKANGYDVKVLRKLIAERRKSADERDEEEATLDAYRAALHS